MHNNKDKGLTDYEQTSTDVKSYQWSERRGNDGGLKKIQVVLDEIVAVTLYVYKFVKKVLPAGDQRRWLLLDMAVFLARGRGQMYSRAT